MLASIIPVDHVSQGITPYKKNYSQFEKESLAYAWGMYAHRYYLLGIKFEALMDHKRLLGVFNGSCRDKRHKLKARVSVPHVATAGKTKPMRVRLETSQATLSVRCTPAREDASRIQRCKRIQHVNTIIYDDMSDAINTAVVEKDTARDQQCQQLIRNIKQGRLAQHEHEGLARFKQIFHELTYTQRVVMRRYRLFIPKMEPEPGQGILRTRVVDLAHEGHLGVEKTKRQKEDQETKRQRCLQTSGGH